MTIDFVPAFSGKREIRFAFRGKRQMSDPLGNMKILSYLQPLHHSHLIFIPPVFFARWNMLG